MSVKKALFEIGNTEVYGNNHLVPIVYGFELTEKERAEFDYYHNIEDLECSMFFRYKGNVYDLSQIERVDKNHPFYGYFDGFSADTFFSGIAVKFVEDDQDFVKVYTCYS